MDLSEWNRRLEEHFSNLAGSRRDIPVFALEHGLSNDEVASVQSDLRNHIRLSPPNRNHRLVWVVYATEIGYGYAGDEYWQTFEEKTPWWTERGDRSWIRAAFEEFRRKYAGAVPSGPWAEQFSIIAWPITHAILPKDLQQQLARLLYENRRYFSAELFERPQMLGEFIASRSWNTSARFQKLVQAPALVGQIAAALLLQGKEGFEPLLDSATLKRIGDDVDRERRGREWLRVARQAAVDRSRIRGLTQIRTDTPGGPRVAAPEVGERLGVEPRLVLRPAEQSRWEVSLEIPDLSNLLHKFPQLREILTGSRCFVEGAAGRPLARGRCLHGSQRIALNQWPREGEVLLKFERSNPQLDYLLRTECMLRPAPSRLFKIANDGLAYESRGRRVRPGGKYIYLSTARIDSLPGATPIGLNCRGANAVYLDIPKAVTAELQQTLKALQVDQFRTVDIWPAGLGSLTWDESGYSEWVSSEVPVLAIQSDHVIEELSLSMKNGGSPIVLTPAGLSPGQPVFVELPALVPGLHQLNIEVVNKSESSQWAIETPIAIRVREPVQWSAENRGQNALRVELEPPVATLQELWEGRAKVQIYGPNGRAIKCSVRLSSSGNTTEPFDIPLGTMQLPITSEDWRKCLSTGKSNVNRGRNYAAQDAYDGASKCEVLIDADELGGLSFVCERAFTPLRWSLRRQQDGYLLHLHNDSGHEAVVETCLFDKPLQKNVLPASAEFKADLSGGLHIASAGPERVLIVVPPFGNDPRTIGRDPRVDAQVRSAGTVVNLLTSLSLWASANIPGNLFAGFNQRKAIKAIETSLFNLICGWDWARAEEVLQDVHGLADMKRRISGNGEGIEIGSVLQNEVERIAGLSPASRAVRLAELIKDRGYGPRQFNVDGFGISNARWLSEFALRMASNPASVEAWSGSHLRSAVQQLLDSPELMRISRFLVLAVNLHQQSVGMLDENHAYWEWQQ